MPDEGGAGMDQEQAVVPDRWLSVGETSAHWDQVCGVVFVESEALGRITLSPSEVRELCAWVEEHHLD